MGGERSTKVAGGKAVSHRGSKSWALTCRKSEGLDRKWQQEGQEVGGNGA